ncbi:MAG: peptidoglycan DD-metalloendopeptidase family protein [Roseobacter sp.]|nr:peptidoglycan DD-metalloendopeptidase family protein [Roseobacter sp.]
MRIFPSRRRALKTTMTISVLALLTACSQGFDYDLRGLGGGFSTADAASRAATTPRPIPDNRGVISYPNYQVAVAERGDTIESMASRLGLDALALAQFNGIDEDLPLRRGEIVALPTRVAEPSPQTGAAPVQPGAVDIGTLAGSAIDRSTPSSGGDVRVAALPSAAPAPATPASEEPIRHKVVRGETAYTISRLYQVPVATLAEWNGLGADFSIREGQFLLIPVAQQAPPPVVSEEVPKPGSGSPTPLPPSAVQPLPEANVPSAAAARQASEAEIDVGERTEASDVARMLLPVNGAIIREYAKGKNEGINIKAAPGSDVISADEGTVAAITKSAEGVPIIVIRHEPELLTVYANVTDVSVKKGDRVARGDPIAKLRDGNDSFVHFEVRRGFDSVDPMPFLR